MYMPANDQKAMGASSRRASNFLKLFGMLPLAKPAASASAAIEVIKRPTIVDAFIPRFYQCTECPQSGAGGRTPLGCRASDIHG